MSGSTTHPISSNSPSDATNREAIERVARRYRAEGYEVVVDPQGDRVPAFAAGFHPDLVAVRGDGAAIVEIKTNRLDVSKDTSVTRLAEVVASQPGWRFDLVVLEEETAVERASAEASEPSDEQLGRILRSADDLAEKGYTPYACVVGWAGLEAAMRRLRDGAGLSGRTAPNELMRTLYSNGSLSREQFDRLKSSYAIRTQVVHGLVPPAIDPELVRYLTATARFLAYGEGAALQSS